MARIVDVEQFLKNFPFEAFQTPFHFVVSDPVADWNNGIFGVQYNHGEIVVSREAIGKAVQLDIQTLSCLLMNYRRPAYLERVERLNTDSETLALLESIIPDMEAYFSDYF
jgi:predicted acetyltransferase